MSVPSYSFHYLLLKLPNKGMKEYFKIIFFIHFYSISFPSLKRAQAQANFPLLSKVHFTGHLSFM